MAIFRVFWPILGFIFNKSPKNRARGFRYFVELNPKIDEMLLILIENDVLHRQILLTPPQLKLIQPQLYLVFILNVHCS